VKYEAEKGGLWPIMGISLDKGGSHVKRQSKKKKNLGQHSKLVEHPSNTKPLVQTAPTTAMKQCEYQKLQNL
jgi:hypothetical protein